MTKSVFYPELFKLRDIGYQTFHARLLPEVDPGRLLGVRRPDIRSLSKALLARRPGEVSSFIMELPHFYVEEMMLHGDFIAQISEENLLYEEIDRYLPHVDNWSVCDTFSPLLFKKNLERPALRRYIENRSFLSTHLYERRFGVNMLIKYFLKDDFSKNDPLALLSFPLTDHYEQMAVAWYFSQALIHQQETILPYFLERNLPESVLKKARQKVFDSKKVKQELKERIRNC